MTDNELLQQFFQAARQTELPDNGFTERVMQQLPSGSRSSSLLKSRLWTAFCIVIAVTLFVLLRGWELIGYGLLMLVNNSQALKDNLIIFIALAVVGGLVGISETVRRERYSVI